MSEVLIPSGHLYPLYKTKFQDLYGLHPERVFGLLVAAISPTHAAELAVKHFWHHGDLAVTDSETYTVHVALCRDGLPPVEVEVTLNFTVTGTIVT